MKKSSSNQPTSRPAAVRNAIPLPQPLNTSAGWSYCPRSTSWKPRSAPYPEVSTIPPTLLITSTSGVPSGTASTSSVPASFTAPLTDTPSPPISSGLSVSAATRKVILTSPARPSGTPPWTAPGTSCTGTSSSPVGLVHRYRPSPVPSGPNATLSHSTLSVTSPPSTSTRYTRAPSWRGSCAPGEKPGVRHVSRRNRGRNTTLPPTAPSPSSASSAASIARSQPGSGMASLLSSTAYSVSTARSARLLPPANPVLVGLAITSTHG